MIEFSAVRPGSTFQLKIEKGKSGSDPGSEPTIDTKSAMQARTCHIPTGRGQLAKEIATAAFQKEEVLICPALLTHSTLYRKR